MAKGDASRLKSAVSHLQPNRQTPPDSSGLDQGKEIMSVCRRCRPIESGSYRHRVWACRRASLPRRRCGLRSAAAGPRRPVHTSLIWRFWHDPRSAHAGAAKSSTVPRSSLGSKRDVAQTKTGRNGLVNRQKTTVRADPLGDGRRRRPRVRGGSRVASKGKPRIQSQRCAAAR